MKPTFQCLKLIFGLAVCAAWPTIASAAVIEEFNETRQPGFYYWIPDTIGWYWTSPGDFNLTSIQTKLNTRGVNVNNNFLLTVSLFTERPAAGGTLIDSFTVNPGLFGAGWTGGGFGSPVSVNTGATYFIGFSGWNAVLTGSGGGGVNWVEPLDYAPGTVFDTLFPGYMGANFEIQMNPGPNPANIDMPILRIEGDLRQPTTGGNVPEPAAAVLLVSGLGAVAVMRRRVRGSAR